MFIILYIIVSYSFVRNKFLYIHQGRIQDFVLGGTKVGEGSGDRLRFPVGPGGQSPPPLLSLMTNKTVYTLLSLMTNKTVSTLLSLMTNKTVCTCTSLFNDKQNCIHTSLINKMNCELMLTYDTPALWQTGSRNLTGQKTLPTIWGNYMKLVTKYQISAINSC